LPIEAYYDSLISQFLADDPARILGVLAAGHHHSLDELQRWAWVQQITILRASLSCIQDGRVFFEFYIPRMGKRADVVVISGNIVFVIEFKVGASEHTSVAFAQVEDYALDLKNFHEGSHLVPIVPILVSTKAASEPLHEPQFAKDLVAAPIGTNAMFVGGLIKHICATNTFPSFHVDEWLAKGYKPTPNIVEAAQVLYRTHSVSDISRSDAGAKNLSETNARVSMVIDHARQNRKKAICFITGVPGSGKTLAGLNIATRRSDKHQDEHAVFLSGNGPLVDVLREALARDKVHRDRVSKKIAEREVRSFVQNIHHFRDYYVSTAEIPVEKVVVFDEAQRAWTRQQAAAFMQRKRGQPDFDMSEPEFLISVMARHLDWCTIICLIGSGQEINTGEAGISGWISAIQLRFPDWEVYVPPRMSLAEYGPNAELSAFLDSPRVQTLEHLHLAVSIRSFRVEALSNLVSYIVDGQAENAKVTFQSLGKLYPIYLTRDLNVARSWLRCKARGTERFGLVASSGAQRLRPEGIHVKAEIDPVNWFLNDSTDVRSSFYLEDVASEFAVQGLELDWVGVCWDGDFHHNEVGWVCQAFKGSRWQSVNDEARRLYLKNAYRVILTRARQGMVIFVPRGSETDHTRPSSFYDGTFDYLSRCGLPVLS
jgi:hypothetical protein